MVARYMTQKWVVPNYMIGKDKVTDWMPMQRGFVATSLLPRSRSLHFGDRATADGWVSWI